MQEIGVPLSAGELPEQRLRRSARRLARREIELPGERGILPRDLRAAGRRNDVLAHLDHHAGNVLTDRRQMAQQGLREGRIAAGAVVGDVVGLRGEGDEKARRVADARQALRMRRGGRVLQWIGAARVQEDQVDALALLLRLEDVVERHGVPVNVLFAVQLGIDRNEVVMGGDLQAMTAVVEQRNVGGGGGLRELGDVALHGRLVEIGTDRDLEAQSAQFRGDVLGVVRRIGERRDLAIGAVADHQSDAGLRAGRCAARRQKAHRQGDAGEADPIVAPPARQRARPVLKDWRHRLTLRAIAPGAGPVEAFLRLAGADIDPARFEQNHGLPRCEKRVGRHERLSRRPPKDRRPFRACRRRPAGFERPKRPRACRHRASPRRPPSAAKCSCAPGRWRS